MAEIDTEQENYTQLTQTPSDLEFEIDESHSDDDLLVHHVAGYDHEIYGLDCTLKELLNV
ncbi:MAG: hypothetical protein SNF68_03440 [Rikenellaceae bacterium]